MPDQQLSKAKPIRDGHNTSGIKSLRRKKESYWADIIVLREE